MNLDQAIELISTISKHSTASDEFRHVDLSLVAADKREKYHQALTVLYQALENGDITRADLAKKAQINT